LALLEIKDLEVRFDTPDGELTAVNRISLSLDEGSTLGIVGESGSGKSQTVLAIMGLLASNGHCSGSARFHGTELLGLDSTELNRIRGRKISMIFQDPMTSLNPYLSIATQMTEVLTLHKGMTNREARREAIDMLDAVHLRDAARRIDMFPHEFSGGMRQRVMIAMALLCRPDLLIADEPTTALDVTVQDQILSLLEEMRAEFSTAVILITHDLGVVAGLCDQVLVMYGGRAMEYGGLDDIFNHSRHPYTRGLLKSVPRLDRTEHDRLPTIPGNPPSMRNLPAGCPFEARCDYRLARCRDEPPSLVTVGEGHAKACHLDDWP
jgi:oligopeptide transport system ATP-binding protein